MAGIKETLDAVAMITKVADAITAAKADGSIDWKDLTKLGPVVVAMKTAVDGGALIPGEMKDLDAAEIETLFNATVEAAGKLISAIVS